MFSYQYGAEFRHRDAWLFLKDKYKWTNTESTQARRTRGRVTGEDEPEIFGEDAIPCPSGAPGKSKSQRSSASSSATSGSSKHRLTEFFQEQIQLDREAKKESLDRELAARLAVVELQKRNEDLKILTFDTTGMNPDDAAKIEALKAKTRATFPQHSSQPQFKIPQAQEPREPKRKQKRTGKQPVIELDEGDENEDMETRRLNIRWNNKEEILLADAWIEHSQDANIGKDQRDEIYWNKIFEDFHDRTTGPARTKNMLTGKWTRMHGDCQRFNAYYKQANRKSGENEADLIETVKTVYLERVGKKFQYPHVWKILKEYPKWDAAEPIDGDNLQEVFGPDKRERPAGKQRAVKKQKSVETSGSTGGSQSESVSSLVSQDYRRKCDAAERAYEAQREKDLAIKKCEEMKFLMIDTSNLPPHKRAFIERQQAEIMKKYEDAGVDD
ncbi:hypothetical protein Tco_0385431 [Tanacetum coccineum]